MKKTQIETERLTLVARSREEMRAEIEQMKPDQKAALSSTWLRLLETSRGTDPWIHGFALLHRADGCVIGTCGFKGPPEEGLVEIAYGVALEHQGNGYATEAAAALVRYAFNSGVKTVVAHTMPERNASTRVLTKCGFTKVGEVVDPEDGLVWKWETGSVLKLGQGT